MKKLIVQLMLTCLTGFSALSSYGQADIQIIHNAADPSADTVDIYVNGSLALNDFTFRSATPFITLPSGVLLNIGVAPGNSTSAADTIKNFQVTLTTGHRYAAIASGVLTPGSFAVNPDARSTAFTLFIADNVQNTATLPGNVDFIAMHGATDAPAVDVKVRNGSTLVNNASYGDITSYVTVPAGTYLLDVTAAAGSPIVASFNADLSTIAGSSAVVFASGFLTPSANQNGPAFGLFAALANGTVVQFPATSLARLQVIHNAADPALDTVDVYVDGSLFLSDFIFRTATSFLDVPAGTTMNIGLAPGNSASVSDTVKNFQVTLANGGVYTAIANGVLNPANFAVNPDAVPTGLTLFVQDQMEEAAINPANVDFRVLHGATDAPTVDVKVRSGATLVNNASYGDITSYVTVPAGTYILDVTAAAGSPIVASFNADLSTIAGSSAMVFASGFLTPSANQNGPAFGLFAALANGTVVQFPAVSLARLQVIHNAADPALDTVDVYVDGSLFLSDFIFRTATSFLDVPAGTTMNIGLAPGNSASVSDTVKNFQVTLANGGVYTAIANGVLNPANFAVNPDAVPTGLTLFVQDQMEEAAINPANVDFRVLHGATDAPTVDVKVRNGATLVNNAAYSDITSYLTVPAGTYLLDVTAAAGSPIVASFNADLSTIAGSSAVVFASGFLTPSANQNGPAFGLFAALANGAVVQFPSISTARLQVIHNAADPAADSVDIYVDGTLVLSDFKFRTATPYVDVPAGVVLNVGVAPGNSTSVSDTLKNFQITLANGGEYIAVASGVLNPANFAVNPDAVPTAFTVFLQDQMQEAAINPANVDFRVVHGCTDAPTVDVLSGATNLVNNAIYSNITSYISVPAANYQLDITPGNNNSIIVASFAAPLVPFTGQSGVILATGFLNPSANQNGAAFGLMAVFADGTVVLLSNVTAIDEYAGIANYSIYPNPATEQVEISLAGNAEKSTVQLVNALGQVLITKEFTGKTLTLPVHDLDKGLYFVCLQNATGRSVSKLIVE